MYFGFCCRYMARNDVAPDWSSALAAFAASSIFGQGTLGLKCASGQQWLASRSKSKIGNGRIVLEGPICWSSGTLWPEVTFIFRAWGWQGDPLRGSYGAKWKFNRACVLSIDPTSSTAPATFVLTPEDPTERMLITCLLHFVLWPIFLSAVLSFFRHFGVSKCLFYCAQRSVPARYQHICFWM